MAPYYIYSLRYPVHSIPEKNPQYQGQNLGILNPPHVIKSTQLRLRSADQS